MSTTTHKRDDSNVNRVHRTRWFMPAFSIFLGVLMLVAFWIGDELGAGLGAFGVMAAVAALFFFGGRRSETLAGIGGPARDERWEKIDLHATAMAGGVLVFTIIGAWLVEVAQGGDGSPYTQLGAVGGLAYILSVAFLRWRS
jgi:hypothetical protein